MPEPSDRPAGPASSPRARQAGAAAARHLHGLQLAVAPVLSAPALAVAVALAGSVLLACGIQFGGGLYDTRPDLAYLHAGLNALLAVALAALMLLRPTWHRAHVVVLGLAGLVLVLSLWSSGAKLQYRRGLVGNAFYALPHQPFHYDAEAQPLSLISSDGVRLAGTLIARNRRRAIALYPSWRTNRDAFSIATLAQWLSTSFDVLVLDPRGQGESGGAKSPDGQEKNDILAAVAYLHGSGHAMVGVLTEEDGALPAVQAAALHEGIESLALVAPSRVWGESLGQEGRFFDPTGLPGRLYWRVTAGLRLSPGPAAPSIAEAIRYVSPTPVLLTGVKTDAGSAIDQLHLAAGEPKSLIMLGGDGKPVNWTHFAEYFKAVEQWFELTLHAPEAPPS